MVGIFSCFKSWGHVGDRSEYLTWQIIQQPGGADPTTIIINENVCNSHVLGLPGEMKEKSKNEELQALAYYAAHLLETRGPQFLTAASHGIGAGADTQTKRGRGADQGIWYRAS